MNPTQPPSITFGACTRRAIRTSKMGKLILRDA